MTANYHFVQVPQWYRPGDYGGTTISMAAEGFSVHRMGTAETIGSLGTSAVTTTFCYIPSTRPKKNTPRGPIQHKQHWLRK